MKKLLLVLFLLFFVKVGFAQKNFEGEIDYKTFIVNGLKKDTTVGGPYKIFFGKNAIKIESFTPKGILFKEQIMLLDSLKEFVIDHRGKTYWVGWKFNASTKMPHILPWGMNKVEIIYKVQKIAGYETYVTRLTNTDKSFGNGHVDLNTAKSLSFQLSPSISKNPLIDGCLIFGNNIMIGIKIVAGTAPYTQIEYIATKVAAKEIAPSAFDIPPGYTLKIPNEETFK